MKINGASRILLLLAVAICSGCASMASRPVACRDGLNNAVFYGWAYYVGGLTLQQGDCAAIEPLKIEMGEYYSRHQDKIIQSLKDNGGANRQMSPVSSFADIFNGSSKGREHLVNRMFDHKSEIFGNDCEFSSRQVMKNIQSSIEKDEILRIECK